jgi:hypothetical protein
MARWAQLRHDIDGPEVLGAEWVRASGRWHHVEPQHPCRCLRFCRDADTDADRHADPHADQHAHEYTNTDAVADGHSGASDGDAESDTNVGTTDTNTHVNSNVDSGNSDADVGDEAYTHAFAGSGLEALR